MAENAGCRRRWGVRATVLCATLLLFRNFALADADPPPAAPATPPPAVADAPTPSVPVDELAAARAAAGAGEIEQAVQHYQAALLQQPSAAVYLEAIAWIESAAPMHQQLGPLWEQLLAQYPDDPQVLLANGDRLLRQGSLRPALAVYQRVAELDPHSAVFMERSGDCYSGLGDWRRAQEAYTAARRSQDSPLLVRKLAVALVHTQGPEAVAELWERAKLIYGDDAALLYQHALYLDGQGQPAAALIELERCRTLDRGCVEALDLAGSILHRQGLDADAAHYLAQACHDAPSVERYLNAAAAWQNCGDDAAAEQCYRDGLILAHAEPRLIEALAGLLARTKRVAEATALLLEQAQHTTDAGLYLSAAILQLRQGDAPAAEQSLRSGLVLAPGQADLRAYLAYALAAQARTADCIQATDTAATELAPEELQRFIDILSALIAQATGQEDAAAHLIKRFPQQPGPYLALARQQQRHGEAEAALETVRRGLNDAGPAGVLRLEEVRLVADVSGVDAALPLVDSLSRDPEVGLDASLLELELLTRQGGLEPATEFARTAAARYPRDPRLLSALVNLELSLKHYSAVVNLLTAAAHAGVEYPERQLHLGLAYLRAGNYAKAVGHLTAAHTAQPQAGTAAALAEACYLLGQLDQARAAVSSGLSPEAPAAVYIWQGFLRLEDGDWDGAAEAFTAARQTAGASQDDLAWCALGRARLALTHDDVTSAASYLDTAAACTYGDIAIAPEIERLRGMLAETPASGGVP